MPHDSGVVAAHLETYSSILISCKPRAAGAACWLKVAGWFNNNRAIVLSVQRQPGVNTVEVVDAIKKLLPDFRERFIQFRLLRPLDLLDRRVLAVPSPRWARQDL